MQIQAIKVHGKCLRQSVDVVGDHVKTLRGVVYLHKPVGRQSVALAGQIAKTPSKEKDVQQTCRYNEMFVCSKILQSTGFQ